MILQALFVTKNPAVIPVPVATEVWQQRHAAIVTAAAHGDAKLVFIGDSIVHAFGGEPDTLDWFHNRGGDTWDLFYRPYHALNLGVSGDKTENVLWRLDNGELGPCKPSAAVVMVGANNVVRDTAEQIAGGVEAVCFRLRAASPKTKILLVGILPRGTATSPEREKIRQTNLLLAKWATASNVSFQDVGAVFLDEKGEIPTELMPDQLQPMALGYRKWAMAIEGNVSKFIGRKPITTQDPTNSAVVPVTQNRDYPSYDWPTRFAATLTMASKQRFRLALIGDSITHFLGGPPLDRGLRQMSTVWHDNFEVHDAIDLGFGWERTENVLWRLEHGQLNDMPLEGAIVLIGTNNLAVNTEIQIRDAIKAIVEKIQDQKPKAAILIMGIFPRGKDPNDPMRLKVARVNEMLKPLNRLHSVTLLDIGQQFLEKDGTISQEIMGDYLHPSERGYWIWATAIRSWMDKHVPKH